MKKRQKLGQHFLKSEKIAQSIVSAAKITKNENVLEIGTGKGILTTLLCKTAKQVVSFEKDRELYKSAVANLSNITNLKLRQGDGFKSNENFSVFVSNLPYSRSRDAIEWLIQKKFSRAVIMVQKEFAEKLKTKSKKERKAISILTQHALEIEPIANIQKTNFFPQPKVDSVVLKVKSKRKISKDLIKVVNKLFSYRRKTLHKILVQFNKSNDSTKRLDELDGDEIIKIAKQIIEK
ncbi:MAG: Ribosomal RNA adenine methylase transferase [Nitrosopumilales archaeon]|nr:MAG: Ribosomal RNA adenine methylase transferase [Nitrosopumilales archaeon]